MSTAATEVGPLLLSVKEAAALLGLSEWQVRGLGEEGALPVEKIRGRWYVNAQAVRNYAAGIGAKAEGPCSCGTEATCLDPDEVLVHQRDGQPCYIARRSES